MTKQKQSFYRGIILNPKNDAQCDFLNDGVLVVEGKRIKDLLPYSKAVKKYQRQMNSENTTEFKDSVIMPGFFDMHFHWVQDDVREMPKESLLQWLEHHTFPTEAKYADLAYAEDKAHGFFKKLTRTGTVGGACYGSIHEHSVDVAMKYVKGDFVIGNVLMNMNSPPELTQTENDSIGIVKRLIKKYKRRYALTPRFAITTSARVMKETSKLADRAKCFKQSHLSETIAEIDFVKSIYRAVPGFEKVRTYTEIYQKVGMLGPRSLMGHGIHLSPRELGVLRKTKTVLVHCPTSNAPLEENGLGSGLFDFKRVERAKVRWALGSDIGGGPHLSMLDVMRSFVDQNARAGVKGATYVKALYRATLAGAEILGLGKEAGNLKPGKRANFIVVSLAGADQASSTEAILRTMVAPLQVNRNACDTLIKTVCLDGAII